MRIFHFADVHIGMENYGRIDPKTGYNTRLLDFLNSLDQIVSNAKEMKPDLIVFAGDAYKDRNPSPTHQREFAIRIRQMAKICPVVLVVGNHDLPQTLEKANTLDIFSALEVHNIIVSRKSEILSLNTNSGPIQILTLPWITRSKLLEKNQYLGKNQEEIQKILSKEIEKIVKRQITKLNPTTPAIAVVHISIQGSIYGSERSVMLGNDIVLSDRVFNNPKIKYIALGHIHQHQVVRKNPPIIYSGSINRIDFGEEKDNKGFVLVDIINNDVKYKFIPLEIQKFITIKINLTHEKNYKNQIKKIIKKYDIKNAVVRVKIKLSDELSDKISDSDIRKYLVDADYISSISFDTPEKIKSRHITYIEPSTPIKTLDQYLKLQSFSLKKREILKKYTEDLLHELE